MLPDVTKQEVWKYEENPLDSWDRLLAHAEAGKFSNEEDTFRFRYFKMLHVAPAQNSFMLRCRIPGGELNAARLQGLADLPDELSNGWVVVRARSNLQIRKIAPGQLVNVLTRCKALALHRKAAARTTRETSQRRPRRD